MANQEACELWIEQEIQSGQERGVTLSPVSEKYKSNEHFRTSFTGDNEWYTSVEYVEAALEVDRRVAECGSFYELYLYHG